MNWKEWKFQALTDIWTGDAERNRDRLIPTGIMGSLRWWFEVLVRGLGGEACDPTAKDVRCPQDTKKKPTDPGHHCVVCELFGCTGWARKFRLMILNEQGQVIQNQIEAGQKFTLRFIPLRYISDEEWCLLDATLRLIADYGAIGGKTVFKPSDEPGRGQVLYHRDFGLIRLEERPNDLPTCSREQAERYVQQGNWHKGIPPKYKDDGKQYDYSWASLQNFWCVEGRYLARQDSDTSSFNFIIGRPEPKNQASQGDSWLAGRQQESKKVFSFKEPARTFGFVKPDLVDFEKMKERLKGVWQGFDPNQGFLTGEQILDKLFQQEETA